MHNFYSDTQTQPSQAMRETVLTAVVGDEQRKADSTTVELERRVAELLGKEDAVFLPSGTMCNEIAIRVHTDPGDEVICERSSHIIDHESGGPAAISSVMVHPIDGQRGMFTADQVTVAIRGQHRSAPRSRLLSVENTATAAGGTVWPVEQLDAVAEVAHDAGLATHLDGARVLNATAASGIEASRICWKMDSCWIDLTKGLGAPVGAVLAGSEAFIVEAWRYKQQWGGAMRQSGVLAAMGLYALDNNVGRLADDNARAARIGSALGGMAAVSAVAPVDSNIVVFEINETGPSAAELVETAAAAGVDFSDLSVRTCRIVTHMDVDDGDEAALLSVLSNALS